MDQLPALGTAISEVVRPTFQIYNTLLQKHAAEIKSTPRSTFAYGTDPRQNLDVYYPSSNPSGAGCPILMFIYGGGLINGARTLPVIENGLVHANIGHFFAEKYGFIVAVPDYRLVPQARFPSGGEDIALAVEWIRSNMKLLGAGDKTRDLFIMGNSAGGVHLSTYLFSPVFAGPRKRVLTSQESDLLRLKGAIFLSVPFHFQAAAASRTEINKTYYGDRVREDCPMGLLESLKKEASIAESLPAVKFLLMNETLDPDDEILLPNRDFIEVWNAGETSDSPLQIEVIDGHNHISPPFSLSTGDPKEEAWGVQVAQFCSEIVRQ